MALSVKLINLETCLIPRLEWKGDGIHRKEITPEQEVIARRGDLFESTQATSLFGVMHILRGVRC